MKKLWPFAPGIGASLLTESQRVLSPPSGKESARFSSPITRANGIPS